MGYALGFEGVQDGLIKGLEVRGGEMGMEGRPLWCGGEDVGAEKKEGLVDGVAFW